VLTNPYNKKVIGITMNENVDLKPYLKYNNNVILVLKVLAFPFNWVAEKFENLSRRRTQKMVEKWLAQ